MKSFKEYIYESIMGWFGNSKVVDDQGNPLMVYHGTQSKFETLRTPAWFSDKYEYADNFSAQWGDKGERTSNSRVIKAYLRIENPYETDDWSDTEPSKDNPDWMQKLIDQGYDGIHFVEHSAFGTETEWVAFYPEQIRIVE
jgi:hypothetical protein